MNRSNKQTNRGRRAAAAPQSAPRKAALAVGRGLLIALALAVLLSLIAAAVACRTSDPDALTLPLGVGILLCAAVTAGFVTTREWRAAPALCGTAAGLALVVILFVCSFCLPDAPRGGVSLALGWGLRVGVIGFSLLGAAMAANLPGRRKRKRRK